jgi:hypothetical protein
MSAATETTSGDNLILSDFTQAETYLYEDAGWRGFSDRVMGGISDAAFGGDVIAGKKCARMTGNVTRESNGGFIQMALTFGRNNAELDASAYSGIELLVHGNNEDYNLHIRTADCGWYEDSYRTTFFAKDSWETIRLPWDVFEPNRVEEPLDTARITQFGILGWMREFRADLGLATLSLYRDTTAKLTNA